MIYPDGRTDMTFLLCFHFIRVPQKSYTSIPMKNAVFWDVAPCRSSVNRRFGGTYHLHLHGRKSASEDLASRWLQLPEMYHSAESSFAGTRPQVEQPRNHGSISGRDETLYLSQRRARLWCPPSPIQWVRWAVHTGIKRPGHKTDHSPTSRC
jgi:hypothetical protein